MDYLGFGYVVGSCPVNITGQNKAASRLKCGVDKFGNSQYLCVPNFRKTAIVEYCYNGTVGLQMPGSCLVVNDEGIVDIISCSSFSEGCTTSNFKSSNLYQYESENLINLGSVLEQRKGGLVQFREGALFSQDQVEK
ncbi:uncharacterized protein LOC133200480 [Saccostrea echinata]|uniref:uncharacterized protein LOC133200480 n=1 Tax=Saccostrea echinata TaxID=191078 RepID=UPI002A800DE7|nr:uncharacterized protein LOC133200480 [Saccostrea echinata]